jgi:hypothetical protein
MGVGKIMYLVVFAYTHELSYHCGLLWKNLVYLII